MRREWTIWLGFTAVVLVAVVFVVTRDDHDSSKLSAGTSVPTSVRASTPTTATTRAPRPTSPPTSPTTTIVPTTAPATTRPATSATSPGTVATTPPPATSPATSPATTQPPATEPPLKPSFGPGLYRVNIDLPAGTYRTEGGPYCFWARLSSVTQNPTPAEVIANGYSGGAPVTVSIVASDAAFTTSGCDIWLSV